jgi:hypothetical protein
MSGELFELLELIPANAVPSHDVLMSGIAQPPSPPGRDYSDLFPQDHYSHFRGPLGNYIGGDPQARSPLYAAVQGLYAAHYAFAKIERENDFRRTEATSRGLSSTMLQKHIGSCIAKGYDNLLQDMNPADAVKSIFQHIETKNEERAAAYNQELDYHVASLARLDRGEDGALSSEIDGMPVISGREIALALGEVPVSPEVEREQRREWAQLQITEVRNRLIRLRFERMSALALTELLCQSAIS